MRGAADVRDGRISKAGMQKAYKTTPDHECYESAGVSLGFSSRTLKNTKQLG